MALCRTCDTDKQADKFPRDYRYTDGRRASSCKECAAARTRKWRETQPDAYAASLERRDRAAARAAHKRWRDKNLDRERARLSAYQQANPALYSAMAASRRASSRIPAWANKFFVSEAYDIARKRSHCTGVRYVVDHIVPLQSKVVCGLHVEHNLQVIPEAVNARKGNRWWPDMPE